MLGRQGKFIGIIWGWVETYFTGKNVGGAKKKNDGRWRSLTVNSLFLLDGTAPNIIAIFGK